MTALVCNDRRRYIGLRGAAKGELASDTHPELSATALSVRP